MSRRNTIINALLVLALVWGIVWGVRSYAASRKFTAERLNQRILKSNFADWSALESAPNPSEAKRREAELRDIAGIVNRLDFQEREKNRQNRSGEELFRKLSPNEKNLFIDLTVMESMNRFMEALDSMPPAQRKKFVEQGLREIEDGSTAEEMARAKELGADLLDKISQEGMRAYFEKSTTQTKLDLAPLMEAVNETMQGLRGNEFGPPRQQ
jgi:DNA-directed RNA polymerase specialized sigma24 family protein